jgi:hypothetical protein
MKRPHTKRKPRVGGRDRHLQRLLDKRDKLLLAWQENTAEICGLSSLGGLLDVLVRPGVDEGLIAAGFGGGICRSDSSFCAGRQKAL